MLQSLTLAVTLTGGLAAAATTAAGGPDWFGIAAVITSVSGLVATVGAIWLGSRRRGNARDEALERLIARLDREDP